MSTRQKLPPLPTAEPAAAAVLLAIDPHGLGGVVLRARPGPGRDKWLAELRRLLPDTAPYVRVPVSVPHDRLLGGLDFGATMASGRPVHAKGLLESADGGLVGLSMAERLTPSTAAIVASACDDGVLNIERDGARRRVPASIGVVAFDEGMEPDECVDTALAERLAFSLRPDEYGEGELTAADWNGTAVSAVRAALPDTLLPDDAVELLVHVAVAFGISSMRAVNLAARCAKAAAAAAWRSSVGEDDVRIAAQLVYPQRATRMPSEAEQEQPEPPPESEQEPPEENASKQKDELPDDIIIDAVRANVPDGLLDILEAQRLRRQAQSAGSRGGPKSRSRHRGRPVGTRPGLPTNGDRLNVLATLKTAAPWQSIRRKASPHSERPLHIRKEDLAINRYEDRTETTTIFAVDASGSQAAQRLAEVKGAIELLLSECYVRRDQVALIAFRGQSAELLLPPTRALARAKRSLRALPGGGGTPLAAGLDAARDLAVAETHHGRSATVVLLTDGRANINRSGNADPQVAEEEALAAGRSLRAEGIRSLLVDTSRRPRPRARNLANAMNARYVPLPHADARAISETVQQGVAA